MPSASFSRNLWVYLGALTLLGGGTLLVILHPPAAARFAAPVPAPPQAAQAGSLDALALLLLQILVIIGFAKGLSRVLRFLGQPAVVVEILAGIVLGPSVLGAVAPHAKDWLFPASSFASLGMLSQIGLTLYMFVVGMQLDTNIARRRAGAVVLVSHTSILLPFFLGCCAAWALYGQLASPGAPFTSFALFMGVALSVTAFPVLARILSERRLTGSPMGALALTCAAVGDVTAWCLLAVVVAFARSGSPMGGVATVAGAAVFAAVMLFAVRPLMARLLADVRRGEHPDKTWMAWVLVYLLLSALAAQAVGIHALFGAFIAGVAMPASSALRTTVTERVEYVAEIVLLPLFFALSGLNTDIGLISGLGPWLICAAIIALAVVGKMAGGVFAARANRIPWGDAFVLGALLNTRGLMELVVLNIGYQMGLLPQRTFTMLIIMALVTTVMTGPLVGWLTRRRPLDPTTPAGGAATTPATERIAVSKYE